MPRIARLSPAAVGNGLTAAGRQLKAWWSTGPERTKTPPGLYSRLSLFSFIVFCLNILFLRYYLDIERNWGELVREDAWVEHLTAVLFFSAGLIMFLTAALAGNGWRRWLYTLSGLGLLFAAGEEVNWGQVIFGFATPDFWQAVNPGGFNVHNSDWVSANRLWSYTVGITQLLGLATIAAFFNRKYRLAGIPLPTLLLIFYLQMAFAFGGEFSLRTVAAGGSGLTLILVTFLAFAWFARDQKLLAVAAVIIILNVAMYYLHGRFWFYNTRNNEVREYLFSLVLLLYALQLLRDGGGAPWLAYGRRIKAYWFRLRGRAAELLPSPKTNTANLPPPGRSWERHSWRWAWPAACLLTALASIGLVALDWQKTADLEREYQELTAGPPTAQAHSWNFYHTPGQLTYLKDGRCLEDNPYFYLHIVPISEADLPAELREQGFWNRDFLYDTAVERFRSADDRCMVTIELPDYPIAQIYTGPIAKQAPPASADHDNSSGGGSPWSGLWEVRLDLDTDYYRAAYQPIAAGQAGPPLARAFFDLYRYDNALYYLKESCAPADVADRFFLHLIPENPEDLPPARRPLGFSNLDFDFNRRGHWFDEKCLAIAELPDYPIAEIRTGQFTPAGAVWKVALPAEN